MNTGWFDNKKYFDYNEIPVFLQYLYTEGQKFYDVKPVEHIMRREFQGTFRKFSVKDLDSYLENNKNQGAMWQAYDIVKETVSEELDTYIQKTRLDTDATGKNTSELDYRKMLADTINDGKSRIINSEKVVQKGGFLFPHYKALKATQEIFKDYFIQYNDSRFGFTSYYQETLRQLAENKYIPTNVKFRILDNLKDDFRAYVIMNSPINIKDKFWGTPKNKISELFVGNNSVANRLADAPESFLTKMFMPVFSETPVFIDGKMQRINTIKLIDQRLDTSDQNNLINSWRELLDTDTALAQDLAVVAILQSGFKLSPISFTKYIPSELQMEVIANAFGSTQDISRNAFHLYFLLNNSYINQLVPYKTGKFPQNSIWKTKKIHVDYAKVKATGNLEAITAYENAAKPKYEDAYSIFIRVEPNNEFSFLLHEGEETLYKGVYEVKSNALNDFSNDRSLFFYSDKIGRDITFVRQSTEY
jgi:hypothetical protein